MLLGVILAFSIVTYKDVENSSTCDLVVTSTFDTVSSINAAPVTCGETCPVMNMYDLQQKAATAYSLLDLVVGEVRLVVRVLSLVIRCLIIIKLE